MTLNTSQRTAEENWERFLLGLTFLENRVPEGELEMLHVLLADAELAKQAYEKAAADVRRHLDQHFTKGRP